MKNPVLVYRVHPGDTLSEIAEAYGVTTEALFAENIGAVRDADRRHGIASPAVPDRIFPGTPLVIPRVQQRFCKCCGHTL